MPVLTWLADFTATPEPGAHQRLPGSVTETHVVWLFRHRKRPHGLPERRGKGQVTDPSNSVWHWVMDAERRLQEKEKCAQLARELAAKQPPATEQCAPGPECADCDEPVRNAGSTR